MSLIVKPLVAIVVLAVLGFFGFGGVVAERLMNRVERAEPPVISERAATLHASLRVMDWHSDTLLWQRDPLQRADRGHLDQPRAIEGNIAIQMFTTVTKSPRGQNDSSNSADALDRITPLVLGQRWPIATWGSQKARALYQAERLHQAEKEAPNRIRIVRTADELKQGLAARAANPKLLLALLGTEGSHALDGELAAVDELYDAGFRMFGLQHFFDNKLGGSLHGTSHAGLTEFGRAVVSLAIEKRIIIDVAHSSEAVVRDVLAMSDRPIVVSHTGFKGACDSPRNISDPLMQKIASAGGLIAVGFWSNAICDASPDGIARTIEYGISLVGAEHVALGSDFDGSITSPIDSSEMAAITSALLALGVAESDIALVMGENSLRFLLQNLP